MRCVAPRQRVSRQSAGGRMAAGLRPVAMRHSETVRPGPAFQEDEPGSKVRTGVGPRAALTAAAVSLGQPRRGGGRGACWLLPAVLLGSEVEVERPVYCIQYWGSGVRTVRCALAAVSAAAHASRCALRLALGLGLISCCSDTPAVAVTRPESFVRRPVFELGRGLVLRLRSMTV